MDKVQIYVVCWVAIGLIAGIIVDGQPKEGKYKFSVSFISQLLMLPLYGRIFGWW